jgi:signal peptide peptidase SppA
MRFQKLIEQVYYRPWLITPEGHASVRRVLESKIQNSQLEPGDLVNPRKEMSIDANGIASIDVQGVLGQKLSNVEKCCGNTDYGDIANEIKMAISEKCRGMMFTIDSPGGTAVGNAEIADLIQEIPMMTVAFTDGMACSAAYNIAASCKYIFATKSATVGSIGCIIPWIDESKAWSEAGLKFDPITNKEGDLKSAMHGPTLSEEQRKSLEEYVQAAFEQFKGNVLRNRKIPLQAMRGQGFIGTEALNQNLIDGLLSEEQSYYKLVSLLK